MRLDDLGATGSVRHPEAGASWSIWRKASNVRNHDETDLPEAVDELALNKRLQF